MAAPYVGNQDFRGYLNYLGQQGDTNASAALNYVGNDGGINDNSLNSYYDTPTGDPAAGANNIANAKQYVGNAYNTYNSLNGPQVLGASTGGGGGASAADFSTQKSNIYGTANEAAANQGIGINSSILDLLGSARTGQQSIDNQAVNNELARRQGYEGIMGMVGRGVRSGGVLLSNKNAADSSAAGAIARAYGDIGRRELSGVGNQYEMKNRDIGLAQTSLNEQTAAGARKINESKQQVVNNIVLDARSKFAALDAAMADASLPDRINIEQEKEQIRQQVLQTLSQYDQQLSQGVAGIQPSSADARRSEATRLAGLGQAPENSFNFSASTPAQFQNTGPYPSDLPIFSFPRKQYA